MDDEPSDAKRLDKLISQALGSEVKLQREARLLTRDALVRRTYSGISVQSLFNYETGLRPLTVPRLVELALAMRTTASMMLGLALQRAGIELDVLELRVDLHRLACTEDSQLELISLWAQRVLARDEGASIAVIDPVLITHWSIMIDIERAELVRLLAACAPYEAPSAEAVAAFAHQPFRTARGE